MVQRVFESETIHEIPFLRVPDLRHGSFGILGVVANASPNWAGMGTSGKLRMYVLMTGRASCMMMILLSQSSLALGILVLGKRAAPTPSTRYAVKRFVAATRHATIRPTDPCRILVDVSQSRTRSRAIFRVSLSRTQQ
jgi:hypothetical protein